MKYRPVPTGEDLEYHMSSLILEMLGLIVESPGTPNGICVICGQESAESEKEKR
jgi:hypothetical protein